MAIIKGVRLSKLWRLAFLPRALLVSVLCLSGCDVSGSKSPEKIQTQGPWKVIDLPQWQEVQQSYAPNVLVVDMWAMWCISCIERFPAMVELSHKYQDKKVSFVSLNLDSYDDLESLDEAQKFLARFSQPSPPPMDHYHMRENLMLAFEELDLLGIPAVLVYNGEGKEAFRLTGDNPNDQFSDHDVEHAILSLIDL